MARIARVVVENYPHHVIQRGNRRQKVFFSNNDKMAYLRILEEQSKRFGVSFWAYCLMDNHVHLIAVPQRRESLSEAIGETHRRYTSMINLREGWRGYLWQGRFSSFLLDSAHLYHVVRYVEKNPVRAGIVQRAEEYQWSSARAHINKANDPLLNHCPLEDEIKNWKQYLEDPDEERQVKIFREHMATGRPLGSENFIEKLEAILGRMLKKRKPGAIRGHNT